MEANGSCLWNTDKAKVAMYCEFVSESCVSYAEHINLFRVTLLEFDHQHRSLIDCATHYLFCCR